MKRFDFLYSEHIGWRFWEYMSGFCAPVTWWVAWL
jgi:hypothetical protein